ncbi:MAG: hypothetical protein ACRDHW_19715, partial [Ktedonobacteraceae bacterium]
MVDARLWEMVEQVQQLLACEFACFLPGCADPDLRHPLLDFLPGSPNICASTSIERFFLDLVSGHEHIQALYDLALLSGRIHTSCFEHTEQRCLYS